MDELAELTGPNGPGTPGLRYSLSAALGGGPGWSSVPLAVAVAR